MTNPVPDIPRFARNSAAMMSRWTRMGTDPEPTAEGEPLEFWAVQLDPDQMTSQSMRSLRAWLDSRGPGEHLSEKLREILDVLDDGGRVACSRLLDE